MVRDVWLYSKLTLLRNVRPYSTRNCLELRERVRIKTRYSKDRVTICVRWERVTVLKREIALRCALSAQKWEIRSNTLKENIKFRSYAQWALHVRALHNLGRREKVCRFEYIELFLIIGRRLLDGGYRKNGRRVFSSRFLKYIFPTSDTEIHCSRVHAHSPHICLGGTWLVSVTSRK